MQDHALEHLTVMGLQTYLGMSESSNRNKTTQSSLTTSLMCCATAKSEFRLIIKTLMKDIT